MEMEMPHKAVTSLSTYFYNGIIVSMAYCPESCSIQERLMIRR